MTDETASDRDPAAPDSPLILVTGSTRGIGLGIATHLVATGNRVIIHGRDPGRVEDVSARAVPPSTSGRVVGGVAADLNVSADVVALGEQVRQRWGVPDGLVLNAGGSVLRPGPVEEIDPQDWDRAVRDNLTSRS